MRRYAPAWLACLAAAYLLHHVGGLSWPAVALSALLSVAGATLIVRPAAAS